MQKAALLAEVAAEGGQVSVSVGLIAPQRSLIALTDRLPRSVIEPANRRVARSAAVGLSLFALGR